MTTDEVLDECARQARARGLSGLGPAALREVHGALCAYLLATFRAGRGAHARGLVRVAWVRDPGTRGGRRPAYEVDAGLLRQAGLTQLNPGSTGVGGRALAGPVEENPAAKIALQFARGVAREDAAAALRLLAAAFGAVAARGAAALDLGVGRLVVRGRSAELRLAPEFGALLRIDPRHKRAHFNLAEDLGGGAARAPAGDAPGPRAAPAAPAAPAARAAPAAGRARAPAPAPPAGRVAAVGSKAPASAPPDAPDAPVRGRAPAPAPPRRQATLSREQEREREAERAARARMDALEHLTEALGDPFAEMRVAPKRLAPEPEGHATSLPGLAEDVPDNVVAFYSKDHRVSVGAAKGKRMVAPPGGGAGAGGQGARRGMRMDEAEGTDGPGDHVHYFVGRKPLVIGGASYQRKVRGFGEGNAALEEAAARMEREREAELEAERQRDEDAERTRLALNADARDLVERRRDERRRLQGDVAAQAADRREAARRTQEEDRRLAQAARFGTSVPAPRDEGPEDARREAQARRHQAELAAEIRDRAEALEAARRERVCAEQEALAAERAQIVEGILRTRQESREKAEFEEAALSTQALAVRGRARA